jgi:hypothetical protein
MAGPPAGCFDYPRIGLVGNEEIYLLRVNAGLLDGGNRGVPHGPNRVLKDLIALHLNGV